ncbi:MAG: hypothetical protein A2150_02550 [Candidatus Muproteobacteria bacterium RBG_16_64_11]|uniref:Uncharacterized protein n=1 Tax=Candidatus Muproteobacteria bacterium RBG_16_64_11 TaxID=1817758 RepID=A0A1F6TFH0_9PROT|nr:MAG: hypothetical protein A2150_02550 [Candidatus Muproteobacteria bacterium RBG_16_64_11]
MVGDSHHGSIHLESLLTAAADQHESDSGSNNDLPLTGILKIFKASSLSLAYCALLVFIAALLVPPRLGLRFTLDEFSFRPPRRIGLTPPLRAPPR